MQAMHVNITNDSEITIVGNIKTIEDYQSIKEAVKDIVEQGRKHVTVKILDSISMTSSVIGFFLKLVCGDNINVTMYVKNESLYSLLDTLNLITVFGVKKLQ